MLAATILAGEVSGQENGLVLALDEAAWSLLSPGVQDKFALT